MNEQAEFEIKENLAREEYRLRSIAEAEEQSKAIAEETYLDNLLYPPCIPTMTRNKSNLPFFYATLSRVDGDTYYVALCNTDNATVTELPACLAVALAHSNKPLPEPGDSVECFYDHTRVFIVGYAPFHTTKKTDKVL